MQYDDFFGPTAKPHRIFMPILWGPIINISTFLIKYYYGKVTLLIHILVSMFAVVFTIATSVKIIQTADRESTAVEMYQKYQNANLPTHYVIGVICLFLVGLEAVLGIGARVVNICQARSIVVLRVKRAHKIIGYIILILCKANIYILAFNKSYGIFIQDIICLILFILWKFIISRMGSQISPQINNTTDLKKVISIKELSSDVCVFANYVYDLSPLKIFHPAGLQVIQSIKSKEVDRYIYGMYASEELPEVPKHSHMAHSFSLLDQPIAKVEIVSPFEGFRTDQVPVKIQSLDIISAEGNIYQMMLRGVYNQFTYKGYECFEQLGRYYSITLNKKYTRLYTSVNFLVKKNQILMQKVLKIQVKAQKIKNSKGEYEMTNMSSINMQATEQSIPILFKMYENSKFTQPLVNEYLTKAPQLILSCPKGQGLQFAQQKAGKIIIIAGGTGLYPFSDLIDLIFKEQIMKNQPQFKDQILSLSPLLRNKSFKEFKFHLMGAFNQISDIHPITLKQIAFLSEFHPNFTLTLKTKSRNNDLLGSKKINFHNGGFDTLLEKELAEINKISKIYICGPPRMNEQISLFLRQSAARQDLYSIL